eukprot:6533861-Prymnesium_polylepis.1
MQNPPLHIRSSFMRGLASRALQGIGCAQRAATSPSEGAAAGAEGAAEASFSVPCGLDFGSVAQTGFEKYVCPAAAPRCIGLVRHRQWGACTVTDPAPTPPTPPPDASLNASVLQPLVVLVHVRFEKILAWAGGMKNPGNGALVQRIGSCMVASVAKHVDQIAQQLHGKRSLCVLLATDMEDEVGSQATWGGTKAQIPSILKRLRQALNSSSLRTTGFTPLTGALAVWVVGASDAVDGLLCFGSGGFSTMLQHMFAHAPRRNWSSAQHPLYVHSSLPECYEGRLGGRG